MADREHLMMYRIVCGAKEDKEKIKDVLALVCDVIDTTAEFMASAMVEKFADDPMCELFVAMQEADMRMIKACIQAQIQVVTDDEALEEEFGIFGETENQADRGVN